MVSEHANPLATLGGVDSGGQNVHVAALASHLVRRGHEVTVFTRRDDPDSPRQVRTESGYLVEHVLAGPPTDVPKDDLLGYMPDFARHLASRWSGGPYDVVHTHFWMSGLAGLAAAEASGLPVVHTFHALGTVKLRHQGRADTSPPNRIRLEQRICQRAGHIIATCTDEVSELMAMGMPEHHATVIPCGVDTDLFRPASANGSVPASQPLTSTAPASRNLKRLLMVGRLVPRKGGAEAVRALAGLPDVELVIVGGPRADALSVDPEVRRLWQIAESGGTANRVRFLGQVTHGRMPDLFRSADIVVAVPWYEPFGIVPLEAMACGRPVVGSAVGGMLDTILPGITGDLVRPRDHEQLAQVLRVLLDDEPRRAAYGRAGVCRARGTYHWARIAKETEQVYGYTVTNKLATATEAAG
jgi:glycosyltransferase involved in cell wall biosynthesis